jgi:hypothetical protein
MKAYRLAHPEKLRAQRAASYQRNKTRITIKAAAYRAAHRQELAAKAAVWNLQHPHEGSARRVSEKLGIAREAVLALWQQKTCDVCGGPELYSRPDGSPRHLSIDHCHTTNRIRGVVCSVCNLTLGRAGDNPARLRALADYLEAP